MWYSPIVIYYFDVFYLMVLWLVFKLDFQYISVIFLRNAKKFYNLRAESVHLQVFNKKIYVFVISHAVYNIVNNGCDW